MSSWEGRSRGKVLGYKIFYWTMNNLGLGFAYFILRFVALHFFIFAGKTFSPAWYFFRKKMGKSVVSSFFSIYQNKYVFGQVLIDKVAMMRKMGKEFTFDFEGREKIWEIFSQGKGGVIIGAHAGNWEAAGHFLSTLTAKKLDNKVNVVMYDNEHQQIKSFYEGVMAERSLHIIVIRPDLSHLIQINNALKANEIVCLHGDRFTEGAKTIDCDFMGEKARFPMGPFHLVSRYKKPVAFVMALKTGKTHYTFFSKSYDDPNLTSGEIAQHFANWLAEKMNHYPVHWFNFYNFWKA